MLYINVIIFAQCRRDYPRRSLYTFFIHEQIRIFFSTRSTNSSMPDSCILLDFNFEFKSFFRF